MRIVFVIDNYLHQSNGAVITTKRFVEHLRNKGHSVAVLSVGETENDFYGLEERNILLVSSVARKQDVIFSKPNKDIILRAIKDADVVHLVTPWKTSRVVRKLCEKLNIPTTASFHIQPENITYGMGLAHAGILNHLIYRKFRGFYEHIPYVHAPSNFIAQELKKHGYPTTIKVISNGVSDVFFNQELESLEDNFKIVSTGRYSKEKNQMLLLKAVSKSSHKDRIHIVLAGQGPDYKKLKNFSIKHHLNVEFGFLSQAALINHLKTANLYVHPANVEIEAIACVEAIAVGLVPLISDAKKSATKQFALNEMNLFKQNDVLDLLAKIEYWMSNKDAIINAQNDYKVFAKMFHLDYSITRFEELLKDAIVEHKNARLSKTVKGKIFSNTINHRPVKRTLSAMTYYLIALPLLFLYLKLVLNVKYVNRKNFREVKGGAIVVSNHVHVLDSVMNSFAAFPKRPILTSNPDNFKKPVAGFFVNLLGAVPIPVNILETQIFFNQLSRHARSGRYIHLYPEGHLVFKDEAVRPFKNGAFKLAVDASVPVVPIRISFVKTKFFKWEKEKIILNIGKPSYPDLTISSKEALDKLKQETILKMGTL